jgi:hypothetical protein
LAQTQGESQCGESYYLATELVVVTFAKVLFDTEAPTPWPALNFYQEAEVGPVLADAGLVRGDSEPFRQTYEARSGLVLLTGSADHLCLLRTSSPSVEPRLATPKRALPSKPALGLGPWEVVKEVRRPATRPPPVQRQPQPVRGPVTLFVRKRPGLPETYLQLQPHVALQRELDERGSGLKLPEPTTSQLHRGGLTGAFTLTFPSSASAQEFFQAKVAVVKSDRARYRDTSTEWQRAQKLNHSHGPIPAQLLAGPLPRSAPSSRRAPPKPAHRTESCPARARPSSTRRAAGRSLPDKSVRSLV